MYKKILITGGTGYVGSRCAVALAKKGYLVTVVDKVIPQERGIKFPSDIEFIHGDLREKDITFRCLKDIEVVLHLAANIGPLTYMDKYQADIIQENSAIDSQIYPAVIDNNIKHIVYSSSSMVFQNSPIFPYREEDLKDIKLPTNIYGMSKLVGEYFCHAYHAQNNLDYTIIRYHNIYGPGEDSKGSGPGDIHVIPALLEKVVIKKQYPLEILGAPEATRPFTYVDDAIRATVLIIEKVCKQDNSVRNNDYNIGPDKTTKILDLAKLIWQIAGDSREFEYKIIQTNAITAKYREMVADKIFKLGWQPKIDLDEGIKLTLEWIKSRKDKKYSIW